MKKYVVYSPMRTGSTLYCRVLDLYHQHLYGTDNNVFWEDETNCNSIDYSTDHTIYHLHNIEAFSNAPGDFIKVLTTRNILESVISRFIVDFTNTWHVYTKKEKKRYIKSLTGKQFTINPTLFKIQLKYYNEMYKIANHVVSKDKNSIVLEYQDHALNIKNLCDRFGIDMMTSKSIRSNPYISESGTHLVDKFLLIKNLNELIDIYLNTPCDFRYNERRTISHIKRTYLKTR